MNTIPTFHGSDLEKISEYYNIPQDEIINFGANVNPLGLSHALKEKLKDSLDVISSYPDPNYTVLRNTLSNYCQADAEHIIVGNGSTELISLLISNIQSKKALLLGPTYSEYKRELDLIGCTLEEFRLTSKNDFHLNIEGLFQKLSLGFDFFIICNPNNPTGTALNHDELTEILTFCKSHHIFVMIDETYIEFASDITRYSAIPLTKDFDNLMVLRGVSKFFAAPGLRMGYGITSNLPLLSHLKAHQNPWSLNSIAEFAVEFMLQDTSYIERTRKLILDEKEKCYQFFDNHPEYRAYPSEANFLLIEILDPSLTADAIFEKCIRCGLMIRNCNSFFGNDGEFIRFCFMNPQDNEKLLQCF